MAGVGALAEEVGEGPNQWSMVKESSVDSSRQHLSLLQSLDLRLDCWRQMPPNLFRDDLSFLEENLSRLAHGACRNLKLRISPQEHMRIFDRVTARILVIVSAMLGHASHVLIWARLLRAFVEKKPPLDDAWIQIMSMVGPVVRFVEICFPAENMFVKSPAMRDFAEVVMF